jgi:hypothetical protein
VCYERGCWVVFMRHYGLVARQGNKDTVAHDLAITDDEQETLWLLDRNWHKKNRYGSAGGGCLMRVDEYVYDGGWCSIWRSLQ